MTKRRDRRRFLQAATAAGVGFWIAGGSHGAQDNARPNGKIRFACVGVGGRGTSNLLEAGKHGDVVALCDVDDQKLTQAAMKSHPQARQFHDFRKMFDDAGKDFDAVVVSTPDHTHAVVAATAMRLQKHCFIEKPLARTVHEARQLGSLTLGLKVATQMGNQGVANATFRRALAVVKAGMLGTVKEVHVWSNRPIWPAGIERPAKAEVPAHVKWDLWLGPSPERPYGAGYHPFQWRGWWDFGTGALGDMGTHSINLPFLALDLRDPSTIEAETGGHNKDSFPKWSIVRYKFPVRDKRPALTMTWYDGGKKPPAELFAGEQVTAGGCLIVGDKGSLYATNDYAGAYKLLGNVVEPKVEVTPSPGHFQEFVRAVRGEAKAMSDILDYSGPLTETVLLGNLAVFAGKKIEWDAAKLRATNAPELEPLIHPTYRKGYSL
jgi:predicted dehydrogenase